MMWAGNHPLEHLYNPPFLYVFPKIEQEQSLVETIKIYARRGFPFSQNQLRVLAYEMAARDGQKGFSPIKQRAWRYWLKGFYQWYPEVRKKIAVNLSIVHATGVNPAQIMKFFNEYRKWLDTWVLNYTPNRIWNINECGIGNVPQPTAVVGITGERTFQTVSGEKPQNSMIVSCMSAEGLAMPRLIIFKANKIKPEWREVAETGYMVWGSATGYINGKLFQEFGEHLVRFLTDPVKAAEMARLKYWTGTLLKRHGLGRKGQENWGGGSS